MSTPTKGMATTKASLAKTRVKADLKGFEEIKGPTPESHVIYVTTEPSEKIFDIRIGTDYPDEIIRGLRYQSSDNIMFEVPEKYVERFERQDRVKHGGIVKLNG
jgi:hypothetical protein